MLNDSEALLALKKKFEQGRVKKEGVVKATDRGFGFLECEDRESYFIAPHYMRSLMHGDKIAAAITPGERARDQAIPESLIAPALSRFMARIRRSGGHLRVQSIQLNVKNEIDAEDKRQDRAQALSEGDYVLCRLTAHALQEQHFAASIDEFVAAGNDPQAPWIVSLRALDLPLHPPQAEGESLIFKDHMPHEDLTDLPFVTIDSDKTRDMDDALYAEHQGRDFVLYVAIADPSAYIYPGDRLDRLAAHNAFSIYLPGRDIPMLPRELSEDLCSLLEGQERSALTVRLEINAEGVICMESVRFLLATIRSHRRMSYQEVSDFLELGQETSPAITPQIAANLQCLSELARSRDQFRTRQGASFRSRPDYDFILAADGSLDHIEVSQRRTGHQIVEECMISANLAAGQTLATYYGGGVFSLHEGFDPKYRHDIEVLLAELGISDGDDSPLNTISGFCAMRRKANAQPDSYLDYRIRKLQQFTRISSRPGPHFALGVENYATFTSPIRKYGDLINHRLLKAYAQGYRDTAALPSEAIIERMNVARRLNRSVEREVRDWLYLDYLRPGLEQGSIYKAEVLDISRAGLRVLLVDNGAIGFLPGALICADRRLFELNGATGQLLVGGQVRLRLGDELHVKIVNLKEDTRSIILSLSGTLAGLPPPAAEAIRP